MSDSRFNPFSKKAAVTLPTEVRDSFNRVLAKGDLVTFTKPIGLPTFRVVDIAPNLDPAAPPNTLRLTLFSNVVLTVRAGVVGELVRLLSAEEAGIKVEDTPAAPPTGSIVE